MMARGLQAMGRLKVGAMNQTETAYARTLELRKAAGEVAWYKFEGLKFRLADNTFTRPILPCSWRAVRWRRTK